MKKALSYLYPFTRKVPSTYNGELEISLYRGRKVLDSRTANYSYGSLQRVLRFGLQQISLAGCRRILLLGLGGGSVIQTLREDFDYQYHITAVDFDPVVIELAAQEFGIVPGPRLQIVCADAFAYVHDSHPPFDLVLVDLFVDSTIQEGVFAPAFWQNVFRLLRPGGHVLLNILQAEVPASALQQLQEAVQALGGTVRLFQKVEKLNLLVLAQKPA